MRLAIKFKPKYINQKMFFFLHVGIETLARRILKYKKVCVLPKYRIRGLTVSLEGPFRQRALARKVPSYILYFVSTPTFLYFDMHFYTA